MKTLSTSSPEAEIKNLERFMQTSFKPVHPRPEFVKQLHHRLTDPMIPTVRFSQPLRVQYALLAIASILSGVIFLITASQVIKALMRRGWGM